MTELSEAFRHKIKNVEELCRAIGPRPRQRTVVMCHGVFDLVHPGHIRHLLYAKSKADILVASLTADAHITKANYRPFVPQDLRALNLAALEMVDYVLIDEEATPLANLPAFNLISLPKATNTKTAECTPRLKKKSISSKAMAAMCCSRREISSTHPPR